MGIRKILTIAATTIQTIATTTTTGRMIRVYVCLTEAVKGSLWKYQVRDQTLVADIIITGFLASIMVPVVTLRALDIVTWVMSISFSSSSLTALRA